MHRPVSARIAERKIGKKRDNVKTTALDEIASIAVLRAIKLLDQ